MTKEKEQEKQPEKKLNLAQKLCAIIGDCDAIAKKGKNTMQNYSYIQEADVAAVMRGLFSKHGVFCLPTVEEIFESEYTTKNGTLMKFIRVRMRYAFINADDPSEKYESIHFGDGSDSSDKGLYKALTGCHKYAMIRTFSLGSEEDPERNNKEENTERFTPTPQPKVAAPKENPKVAATRAAIKDGSAFQFDGQRYAARYEADKPTKRAIWAKAMSQGAIAEGAFIYCAEFVPELSEFLLNDPSMPTDDELKGNNK